MRTAEKAQAGSAPRARSNGTGPAIAVLVGIAVVGFALPLALTAHYRAIGIPRSDDWSYLVTLFRLVDQGHLSFNHWVSMSLVGQLLVAAPVALVWTRDIGALQVTTALLGVVGLGALGGDRTHAGRLVARRAPRGGRRRRRPALGSALGEFHDRRPGVRLLVGGAAPRDDRPPASPCVDRTADRRRRGGMVRLHDPSVRDRHGDRSAHDSRSSSGRRAATEPASDVGSSSERWPASRPSRSSPGGIPCPTDGRSPPRSRVPARSGGPSSRAPGSSGSSGSSASPSSVGPDRWRVFVGSGPRHRSSAPRSARPRHSGSRSPPRGPPATRSSATTSCATARSPTSCSSGDGPTSCPDRRGPALVLLASVAGLVLVLVTVPPVVATARRLRARDLTSLEPVTLLLGLAIAGYSAAYLLAVATRLQVYDRYALPLDRGRRPRARVEPPRGPRPRCTG